MATAEALFKGSPAAFESAVRAYDRQLGDQYGAPLGAMLIYRTALIPGVPTKQDVAEVTVAISDLPLAEALQKPAAEVTFSGLVLYWQWRATITAHALPDNRSRLFLRCEDAIWPIIKEHWRMLLAELIRIGLIESAEPPAPAEPVQKRRSVPEPPPSRQDPEYITKRRQTVKEHWLSGRTQREICKALGRNRSTVQRDLNWLEARGEIPARPKRKQAQH